MDHTLLSHGCKTTCCRHLFLSFIALTSGHSCLPRPSIKAYEQQTSKTKKKSKSSAAGILTHGNTNLPVCSLSTGDIWAPSKFSPLSRLS